MPQEFHQDYVRSIQKTSLFCGTADGEICGDANCPEGNTDFAVHLIRSVSGMKIYPKF